MFTHPERFGFTYLLIRTSHAACARCVGNTIMGNHQCSCSSLSELRRLVNDTPRTPARSEISWYTWLEPYRRFVCMKLRISTDSQGNTCPPQMFTEYPTAEGCVEIAGGSVPPRGRVVWRPATGMRDFEVIDAVKIHRGQGVGVVVILCSPHPVMMKMVLETDTAEDGLVALPSFGVARGGASELLSFLEPDLGIGYDVLFLRGDGTKVGTVHCTEHVSAAPVLLASCAKYHDFTIPTAWREFVLPAPANTAADSTAASGDNKEHVEAGAEAGTEEKKTARGDEKKKEKAVVDEGEEVAALNKDDVLCVDVAKSRDDATDARKIVKGNREREDSPTCGVKRKRDASVSQSRKT